MYLPFFFFSTFYKLLPSVSNPTELDKQLYQNRSNENRTGLWLLSQDFKAYYKYQLVLTSVFWGECSFTYNLQMGKQFI